MLNTNHLDVHAQLHLAGFSAKPSGLWGQTWRKKACPTQQQLGTLADHSPHTHTPQTADLQDASTPGWPSFLAGTIDDYNVRGGIWSNEFVLNAYTLM